MSAGFICLDCKFIGDEPNYHRVFETLFKGDTGSWVVEKTCPDCSGDSIAEVNVCEGCELQEAEPGYDDCRACLAEKGECEAEFKRDAVSEARLLLRKEAT